MEDALKEYLTRVGLNGLFEPSELDNVCTAECPDEAHLYMEEDKNKLVLSNKVPYYYELLHDNLIILPLTDKGRVDFDHPGIGEVEGALRSILDYQQGQELERLRKELHPFELVPEPYSLPEPGVPSAPEQLLECLRMNFRGKNYGETITFHDHENGVRFEITIKPPYL